MKMAKEKVKFSAFIVQGLSTLSIAYLTGLIGFVYAWPSYTLENFTSNNTVLSYPLSSTEVSLLGSLTNIGALVATPFCGYAVNTIGRRYSAMVFGLPFVLAWLIISLTTSVPLVIASIGLAGFGAAGQVVSSVYICEIVQDSIRGGLSSTVVSGYFIGLLFSYIIGGQLSYYQVVYAHLTLSVLYVALIMLLKESPVFLVQRGRIEEAKKSIAFYRCVDVNSKEVEIEINKIKFQLDPRLEKILEEEDDPSLVKELIESKPEVEIKQESSWKFLKKSKTSQRAVTTVLVLMASNILMGAIILQVYAEPLFKDAVPTMPSNLCAIFLAIDLMIASLLCAGLVDKYGRRVLMISSSAASGVFTVLIGVQLSMNFAPPWFTVFLIYAYCFVYNLGAATVPFILTAEVFLPEARGICNSMTMACMWLFNFITLIIFNPLVERFGLGPLFYGFSVVCLFTTLYSYFKLPETKGLSADAIQPLFLGNRRKHKVNANKV